MPLHSVIISHLKFCYSCYKFSLASLPIRCTRNKNYIFDISRKSFSMFWKWYTFLNGPFHFYIYCLHQHIENVPGPNSIFIQILSLGETLKIDLLSTLQLLTFSRHICKCVSHYGIGCRWYTGRSSRILTNIWGICASMLGNFTKIPRIS